MQILTAVSKKFEQLLAHPSPDAGLWGVITVGEAAAAAVIGKLMHMVPWLVQRIPGSAFVYEHAVFHV